MLRLVAISVRERTRGTGPGRTLLDEASLAVGAGELVCLAGALGPEGITLLRVAAGRAVPLAGDVWLGNEELCRAAGSVRSELRRSIGHGGRDTPLLGGVSLLDSVTLPEIARGKARVEATAQAFHALSLVDLADKAGEDGGRLSVAEQQLGQVARACVGRPRLVVLDEPALGLDDEDGARVLHALRTRLDQGASVLVASGEPAFVRQVVGMGGRLVHIEEGRVLPGFGSHGPVRRPARQDATAPGRGAVS